MRPSEVLIYCHQHRDVLSIARWKNEDVQAFSEYTIVRPVGMIATGVPALLEIVSNVLRV